VSPRGPRTVLSPCGCSSTSPDPCPGHRAPGDVRLSRVGATLAFLRSRQRARDAGYPVSYTSDPAWLVNEAINRRAGWADDPHYFGTTRPVNGRLPRKAQGDYQRHLYQIAREINTPRLVVHVARLGEHRWLVQRLPHRFFDGGVL
jgi:hypothetical protein